MSLYLSTSRKPENSIYLNSCLLTFRAGSFFLSCYFSRIESGFSFLLISARYYPFFHRLSLSPDIICLFLCAFLAHHCASLVHHYPPLRTPSGLTLGATPPSPAPAILPPSSVLPLLVVPDAIRLPLLRHPPAFPSLSSASFLYFVSCAGCHPAFICSRSTLSCARHLRWRVAIALAPPCPVRATSAGAIFIVTSGAFFLISLRRCLSLRLFLSVSNVWAIKRRKSHSVPLGPLRFHDIRMASRGPHEQHTFTCSVSLFSV